MPCPWPEPAARMIVVGRHVMLVKVRFVLFFYFVQGLNGRYFKLIKSMPNITEFNSTPITSEKKKIGIAIGY